MEEFDALVIGGGPAGATTARLLAQWGWRTALTTGPAARHSMGECLPPSTRKVFRFLGIEEAVAGAGFFETAGNTVWWGNSQRRVESYPEGTGWQVQRSKFDALLLGLARAAGAHLLEPGATPPEARWMLDCSGRAGVLARQYRAKPQRSRTVALTAVWRSDSGWRLPDATHTLVEAYGDGWAWSIPLSRTTRQVAFMVDPSETRLTRGQGVAAAYAAELSKSRAFRRIFATSRMEGVPWGRDASPYTSQRFSGPGFVLAGDAASCIDPLSSFGIKKAMVSGWAAAVAVNTCLTRPAMQEHALAYYEDRERLVFEGYQHQAAAWSRAAATEELQPFWGTRGEWEEGRARRFTAEGARAALEDLRRRPEVRLRLADGVERRKCAGIEGREVVLRRALSVPGSDEVLDFLANIEVCRLAELAPFYQQVPDLFEAYNRASGPVELPCFLTALSTLLACGILINV